MWDVSGVIPLYRVVVAPVGAGMSGDSNHRGPHSRTPQTHIATNWYGSVVVAIDLNRRCGICIHTLDAGDKGRQCRTHAVFEKVLVRDPI
jgi:hypothetical protein